MDRNEKSVLNYSWSWNDYNDCHIDYIPNNGDEIISRQLEMYVNDWACLDSMTIE